MANPAKRKGTAWETAVVRYLRDAGLYAIKPRQEGTRDVGDIHVAGLVTLQAKAYADMTTGIREGVEGVRVQRLHAGLPFGFAVVKRPRKPTEDAYVVMRLADLPDLVRALTAAEAHSLRDKDT